MKKRFLAFTLAFLFLAAWFLPFSLLSLNREAEITEIKNENESPPIMEAVALSAREPDLREGYSLTPIIFGEKGVFSESPFIMRVPLGTGIPQVSIDGQPEPLITQNSNGDFIITPSVPFNFNSIYVFRLNRNGQEDVTWAFQTAPRFDVISTTPRDLAVNAPVRTGIEIEFSFGEALDISRFFSITPHVNGEFITRGSSSIFVPSSPLAHDTIYNVVLEAGVSTVDSSGLTIGITEREIVFSFETEPERQRPNNVSTRASLISLSQNYLEFPSFAPPQIGYWLLNHGITHSESLNINMELFALEEREDGIAALEELMNNRPWWSSRRDTPIVDTSDLSSVFKDEIEGNILPFWRNPEPYVFPMILSPGFYILEASVNQENGNARQALIQITDIATQIVSDDNISLFWLHDMNNGRPLADAQVFLNSREVRAGADGIAKLDEPMGRGNIALIKSEEHESVIFSPGERHEQSVWLDDLYWSVFQLDRTLFRPGDTINFWGFVQERETGDVPNVSVRITESNWFRRSGEDLIAAVNLVPENGVFNGEIVLPRLDEGAYTISLHIGEQVLRSVMFTAQNFVKPPYQLNVSSDKKAVFIGEEIVFSARGEFFEGTPVSNLGVSYSISESWDWRTFEQGSGVTDLEGNFSKTFQAPPPRNDFRTKEYSLGFTATATLPEVGSTSETVNIRVFVNDLNISSRATRDDDGNVVLTANAHKIDLSRLNDETAEHWGDFLGEAAAELEISAVIYENWWERIADGEFYDHIMRQTVTRYRWEHRERVINSFEFVTNSNGEAELNFTIPNTPFRNYTAEIKTVCGFGREVIQTVFIGRDFTNFFNNAQRGMFLYDGEVESYNIGDEAEFTLMLGDEPFSSGRVLYIVNSGGIIDWQVASESFKLRFGQEHVPNARVTAYFFNGHTYHSNHSMSSFLLFNSETRRIDIEITPSQPAFRPGENATFQVRTLNDGRPVSADVNLSFVDEALFALIDYEIDTLRDLYRAINDWNLFTLSTHRAFISDGINDYGEMGDYEVQEDNAMAGGSALAPMAPPMAEMESDSARSSARIREIFEDTAMFANLKTDQNGLGVFSFTMPDNITAWRITASAINSELLAGNSISAINVSLPMFLHYSLASEFLTGDTPYVGVNVYGSELTGNEEAQFEVLRDDEIVWNGTGRAFERLNIPLWTMEESGSIVIRAFVGNHSDAIRHEYQVLESRRVAQTADFYEVTPGMRFELGSDGLTEIIFSDLGTGFYLSELFSLRFAWGFTGRIEEVVAFNRATTLLGEYFPDIRLWERNLQSVSEFQTQNGGISVLPHSDDDLNVTVAVMPFILDDINTINLRRYLWGIFSDSQTENRLMALYGLALLGEPVLLELREYALLQNLSLRDAAYLALGFAALGEIWEARRIYEARLLPSISEAPPFNIIESPAASAVALLASVIDAPQARGLFRYAVSLIPEEPIISIERLAFINNMLPRHNQTESAALVYSLFGQEREIDLSRGRRHNLRIPYNADFEIISVSGSVGASVAYSAPLEPENAAENGLQISRRYTRVETGERVTEFAQDDIIKIELNIRYSDSDLMGAYVITDFLPAGLAFIPNSARAEEGMWTWAQNNGGRVIFYDFAHRQAPRTFSYHARVINPGIFRAEGALFQHSQARDYFAVSPNEFILIK